MNVGGWQKLSLLDYPGHLASIIFTQGCNLRCVYCHNPQLVLPNQFNDCISIDVIINYLKVRESKIEAVVITGGEPTIQEDLIDFVKEIKTMDYLVKIDTNGSMPMIIEKMIKGNYVDYWALDIKAPEHLYSKIVNAHVDFEDVLRSISLIRNSGVPYEFRTTFYEPLINWDDIIKIQEFLHPGDRYIIQQCNYQSILQPDCNHDDIFPLDYSPQNLADNSIYQEIFTWGSNNNVRIDLRSL